MHYAIIAVLSLLGAERSYTVDAALWDIVGELRIADASPEGDFLGDVLPALQEALPVVTVRIDAVPAGPKRYYKIQLDLVQPLTVREGGRTVLLRGLRYVVLLTPDGERTHVTSSVKLDVQLPQTRCGLVNRVIGRVGGRLIAEAEAGILHRAKAKMQGLASQARSRE
jgi:hypothetical protein